MKAVGSVDTGRPKSLRPQRTVLLVDDDATQLKLGTLRLVQAGFDVETASGADEALRKARLRTPDAILSDVLMGDLDGFGLCRLVRQQPALSEVPVILLSSHYRGGTDQELATRVGASALVERTPDFDAELDALRASLSIAPSGSCVVADDVTVYEQHLRTNANKIASLLGRARSAEERYRTLLENANDLITVLTPEGIIVEANERCREVLGVDPADMIGRHIGEFAPPGQESANVEQYERTIEGGAGRAPAVPIRRPDGSTIFMEFSMTVIELDGQPTVFSIGHEVTEQVIAEQRLAAAEKKYRMLIERIPDVIWTTTMDGSVVFVTPNVEQVMGCTAHELYREDLETRVSRIHPDDRLLAKEAFQAFLEGGKPLDFEYRRLRNDGQWVWLRNRATASYERDGVRYADGIISDVSERRRLEESFRQAQKMEAIGQLTGGVAHDFNNILAAILANSHFLIEQLTDQDPRLADVEEIKVAAERGAALTRQLLAFSRRQVLEPTIVDLNSALTGVEKMVRRLIGEDIEFAVAHGKGLGSVRVDVGQFEQVIMNLVVNARDAMPTGGSLLIETSNVDLEDEYAASHISAAPGKYVMVAVSDTGSGMDAETQRHIFEPFFTTKGKSKGTGLGLSTCYGIVKQSGGYIWVYSEPWRGTTFKIYLPRVDGSPDQARKRPANSDLSGKETILLVEDDDRVRNAVRRMLEPRGYRLLIARDGVEAVEIAKHYEDAIHLVLSDVIMPGSSGPEAVTRVQEQRSGRVRALFMSGYTDHAILRNGALQVGMNFIQKPFAPEALAQKVREVLDA